MIRECKKHGVVEFYYVKDGNGGMRYRCKQCAKDAVNKRRRTLKEKAVEYLGGKCEKCGYDKYIGALEFHHKENKDFGISARGLCHSWNKLKKELDKCKLLCSNCHKEIEAGIMES